MPVCDYCHASNVMYDFGGRRVCCAVGARVIPGFSFTKVEIERRA